MKNSINRRSWFRVAASAIVTAVTLSFGVMSADAAAKVGKGKEKGPGSFQNSIQLVPTITTVEYVDGQFFANGFVTATIKGQTVTDTFREPLDFVVTPQAVGCPVLDLALGPIELDLLGLVVKTSPICLTITAQQGQLLGDLLCQIGALLDGGLSLDEILGGQGLQLLPGLNVDDLLADLEDVLNNLLGDLFGRIFDVIAGGSCDILNLTLGPIELNLLGLVVNLDNCNGEAVTVDITGETGQGKLLGNLLCGLLDGLSGATLADIVNGLLGLLSEE